MNQLNELLLALFLVSCLLLAVSSRLLHCIRIVALQGILLGIIPLTFCSGEHHGSLSMAAVNLILKGLILPYLLYRVMLKTGIKRELEPVTGYSLSAFIVLVLALFSFFIAGHLPIPGGAPFLAKFAIPAAFTVVMTGLFIAISRKKALTQVIGFLVFENGITLFGVSVMREHTVIVELGILLDVLVLVFVMGIAVFQISREFTHIDTDRLNCLDDMPEEKEVEK